MKISATESNFLGNSCDKARLTPVRKIGTTRRSLSGILAFRGETAIPFESSLERDFLIRMAFNRQVLDVISQPVRLPFTAKTGREYPYTPDYLVYYRVGHSYEDSPKPLLVEVKYRADIKKHWSDWKNKFRAAHRYAKERDWAFHIYDESRIRGIVLDNIKFLERFKGMHIEPEDKAAILTTAQEQRSTTFNYLLARHYGGIYRAEGVGHIWHLLATRQLDCDLTLPLNDMTELWMPNHE